MSVQDLALGRLTGAAWWTPGLVIPLILTDNAAMVLLKPARHAIAEMVPVTNKRLRAAILSHASCEQEMGVVRQMVATLGIRTILETLETLAILDKEVGEMASQVMFHPGFRIIVRWSLDLLVVLVELCYCSYLDA